MDTIKKIRANFHSLDEILMFMHLFFLVTILPLLIKLLTIPQLLKILTPGRTKLKGDRNLRELSEIIIKYTDYVLSLDFWIYRDILFEAFTGPLLFPA